MESKLDVAQEAAIGFSRRLRSEDAAQVTAFSSSQQIRQTFTNDAAALEAAIRQITPSGSTALYQALYVALDQLNALRRRQSPDEIRRQAIVVLSDGDDTSSSIAYEDLLDVAKRSDVVLYTIGVRDTTPSAVRRFNESDYVLRSLSQTSGGRAFFIRSIEELPEVYNQIADELANQYTVGYVSTNSTRDGAWRQVALRVTTPGVVARTRTGYFAPKPER
jgi:VWFA-related protein